VFELTAYGSNIGTLRPGEVIGAGTQRASGRSPAADLPQGRWPIRVNADVGMLTNPVVGAPVAPITTH
jgi:2-keto-4-pentenoate hydratase/2-oxohepta-3-ene-1,7-dioic acid hydratase in catechol pathway